MVCKYDPLLKLEQFMTVGTATCTEVTENFATFEDNRPMTAGQFQTLLEGDWILQGTPQVVGYPDMSFEKTWYYTFYNHGVGV